MTELQLTELQAWGRNKSRDFMADYDTMDPRARREYYKYHDKENRERRKEVALGIYEEAESELDFTPEVESFDGFEVFAISGMPNEVGNPW